MYKKLFFGLLIFSVCMQMYASECNDYERRQAVRERAIVDMTQSLLKLKQMNLPIDEHDVFSIEHSCNNNVSVIIGYKTSFFALEEVSALPCYREDYTKKPDVQCILNAIATTYADAMKSLNSSSSGRQNFPMDRIRNDERHIFKLAQNIIGVCY